MHAAMLTKSIQDPIYLLPPHEHLTSVLRRTWSTDAPSALHTSFAWLGHGALMRSSSAHDFLELMRLLRASEDEMKMADNYFAILANVIPDTWLDQGIELCGGQPFTMGSEGDERNLRHITQALTYLDDILAGTYGYEIPHVNLTAGLEKERPVLRSIAAVCLGVPCVARTNVQTLPDGVLDEASSALGLLILERRNFEILEDSGKGHYLTHSLAAAVDGDPRTSFRGLQSARQGDYISLDLLAALPDHKNDRTSYELVLLMADYSILLASSLEVSADGISWDRLHAEWGCVPATDSLHEELHECHARPKEWNAMQGARHVRVVLNDSMKMAWDVREIWLRATLAKM